MPARVVELCEAVKDHILSEQTGAAYSFSFSVIRTNWVNTDLADTPYTKVYVYPAQPTGSTTRRETRESFSRIYSVNVHITNYIDSNDQIELDNGLQLVEELEQSLENVDLAGFQMISFQSETAGRPYFELEAAVERNYYHAIITILYLGTL